MADVPRLVRWQRRCQWGDVDNGEVDDGGVSNGDVSDWDISDGDVADGVVGSAGRMSLRFWYRYGCLAGREWWHHRAIKGGAVSVQLRVSVTCLVMADCMFWLISSERSVSSLWTLKWWAGETGRATVSLVGAEEVVVSVPSPAWGRGLNWEGFFRFSNWASLCLLSLAGLLSLTDLPWRRWGTGTDVADGVNCQERDSRLTLPLPQKPHWSSSRIQTLPVDPGHGYNWARVKGQWSAS